MHHQTRKLTEGAMMVALVGVMLFVNRQFANMIEYAMYWILTFPILIYTAKHGVKFGLITSFCMLLMALIIAAPTTIFYLFCCIITGIVYGEGVRCKWKNGILIACTMLFTFLSYIITTIVFATLFGYNPKEDVEMVRILMNAFGVGAHAIHISQLVPFVVMIVAILMSILQTICIHMMANMLLKRLSVRVVEMKSLFDFHVARIWGFIIIIIWILFFVGNVLKLNQEVFTALLAIFTCTFIFSLGYGALTCMLGVILIRKRMLLCLIIAGIFIKYVQGIIAVIGIFDILFSLREKMKRGVIHG